MMMGKDDDKDEYLIELRLCSEMVLAASVDC